MIRPVDFRDAFVADGCVAHADWLSPNEVCLDFAPKPVQATHRFAVHFSAAFWAFGGIGAREGIRARGKGLLPATGLAAALEWRRFDWHGVRSDQIR